MTSLDTLRDLLERGDGADRAFVDAMIRMRAARTTDPGARAVLEDLHRALREASRRSHGALRAEISRGTLRGPALRARFEAIPSSGRDHFVEEVLGIAYPPLDEAPAEPDLIAYTPAGYDEIVHALDVTRLGPGDRFLDVGSGMGKAVMLAALLSDATCTGLERDRTLHGLAERAAGELGVRGARYEHGDAREVALADADVVFMYLPFTGGVLATVMDRLLEGGRQRPPRARGRFLCAGALDLERHGELAPAAPPRSWLHVYAWR